MAPITFEGEECRFSGIADSERRGIIIIHQELALIPLLSIAENIFLGNERASGGVIDWSQTFARTDELLAKVGLRENPKTLVTDLGLGKQQLVEIAKALSKEVKLLILDEPTSSLNEKDSDALLELLLEFKRRGISSILISHKLNEIAKVADTITVLRDGATVSTLDCTAGPVSEEDVIRDMVGRDLEDRFPKRDPKIGETIFEVRDWTAYHPLHSDRKMVDRVSFHVKRGEVVGVAGLMGAGRTELAMSLFGRSYGTKISGEAFLHGRPADLSTVQRAISAGLCYATEDRKSYGLVLEEPIKRNITLANLPGISKHGVIDDHREFDVAEEYRDRVRIKSSSVNQEAINLSGGNQQKVVLSKWLFAGPEVLILDEPTRGIDVGAKAEIYGIIAELAATGKAIVVISSELPELLGICDRLYGHERRPLRRRDADRAGLAGGDHVDDHKLRQRALGETSMSEEVSRGIEMPAHGERARGSQLGFLRRHMREYGILIALIVIMALFQILTGGILMRPVNLTNLILQNSYIVIMAVGMLMVIVCGHIDLSVGSVMGFIGALAAVMIVEWDMNYLLAGVLCLAMGALIGAAQGYWVAYWKIPSFIVTLSGMLVFKGLMMKVLGRPVGRSVPARVPTAVLRLPARRLRSGGAERPFARSRRRGCGDHSLFRRARGGSAAGQVAMTTSRSASSSPRR